jgi:hypothetical protein
MNNLLVIVAVVVIFVMLMCNRKENLYGDIVGNVQKMYKDPRDRSVCHTDYCDDNCKFVALNCIKNNNSLLRDA